MSTISADNTLGNDAANAASAISTDALSWTIVRVATGLILVPHGAQKLFGWAAED